MGTEDKIDAVYGERIGYGGRAWNIAAGFSNSTLRLREEWEKMGDTPVLAALREANRCMEELTEVARDADKEIRSLKQPKGD